MTERMPSRAALVEVRNERDVVVDGHRFLDEKRVLLAQRILAGLNDYRNAVRDYGEKQAAATEALFRALAWHGLEELQVYPPRPVTDARIRRSMTPFMGLRLTGEVELRLETGDAAPPWPSLPSPEAARCAELYARLLEDAARLSAMLGDLLRLLAEYRLTERRVRALENVVLPEVRAREREIGEAIEDLEMEDILRVHLFAAS